MGNDLYRNEITGATGQIPIDQAMRVFGIRVGVAYIAAEYPIVEELIKKLKLTYEQTKA